MELMHEYAQPFFFEGNDEGCLLIHGFTGTPAHMRLLGEELHKAGYTVSGILLRGHGTCVEDMEGFGWKDWMKDAIDEYQKLTNRCRKVYVLGLSMGGVLTLRLAQLFAVDKIVPIAAPIKIFDRLAPYAFLAKYFMRFKDWPISNIQAGENTEYKIEYKNLPVSCVPSLLKLMRDAEKNLYNIQCPTLIVQSHMDKTVKPESAQIIYDRVATKDKELLWLDNSKHVSTLGPERKYMHEKIIDFLKTDYTYKE